MERLVSASSLDGKTNLWKHILVYTAIAAFLSLIILGIRISSAVKHYDLFRTVGDEEHHVYGIWKVQNGYPLYEYPNRPFYNLIGYNYLFYHFYGWALSAFEIRNEGILLYGKFLTLFFALFGIAVHWCLMRRVVGKYYVFSVGIFLSMMAIIVWLGSYLTGWWSLTNRPDIPAAALITLALLTFILGSGNGSISYITASSLLFFLDGLLSNLTYGH